MKRINPQCIGYFLIIGLMASLILGMVACGSKTTIPVPPLSSIDIKPASSPNLGVGSTENITATGHYADGTTLNLTPEVNWSSDNTGIASIDSTGLAIGEAIGIAKITAAIEGITSPSLSLTVIPVSSIAITPNPPAKLNVGATQQFKATATYSDGSTADISSKVTWSSDTAAKATIDSTGLATGVAVGNANITANYFGITSLPISLTVVAVATTTSTTPTTTAASTSITTPATTVAATLSSIAVTPTSPASLTVGSTRRFTAIGTYSDGSTADITLRATWISDTPSVTIDSTGLARAVAIGNARITAALSGVTSPAVSLTLVAPTSTTTSP